MTRPFFRYRLSSPIVVAAILLSLSSCGSGTDPVVNDNTGADPSEQETEQESTDQVGTDPVGTDQGGTDPVGTCLLYTSPSPRDATLSRMPSSA